MQAYCYRRSSVVCLSVCLLVTFVSPAETAEPIEMPFWGLARVGPRNNVIDGVKVGRIHSRPRGVTSRRCKHYTGVVVYLRFCCGALTGHSY